MNIIYICHYFAPEIGAPSARGLEHCRYWAEAGHNVKVVTCFPNHPTGKIPPAYKNKLFSKEEMNGFFVYRNFVYATPNEGFIKKTLGHLSFMISSVLFSLRPTGKADVVIVSSPTFFSIFSALVYKFFKRAPLVLDVRDLWPAAIIELGVLRNRLIIKTLEKIELFFYRRADKVVVVTEKFKENIAGRGIERDKLEVITNGVDTGSFSFQAGARKTLREQYALVDKYVLLYIGALGISHALEKLIDVADLFERDKTQKVVLLIVGEGAEKNRLTEYANALGLDNVLFLPAQPKENMPGFYSLADICLVPLKNIKLFESFIPSKMFEMMACERPIVASLAGEAKAILESSGAALVAEPENTAEIYSATNTIISDAEKAEMMGKAGREFVKKYYSRKMLADRYLKVLEAVVKTSKR